ESYKYGHGNHETRHECGAPVAKEKPDDKPSEQKADDDRVAYAGDRFPDNVRLVVKDFQFNAGRKRWAKIFDFQMDQYCDIDGVAIRLTADAHQNRGLPVRSDHCIG